MNSVSEWWWGESTCDCIFETHECDTIMNVYVVFYYFVEIILQLNASTTYCLADIQPAYNWSGRRNNHVVYYTCETILA